ncbi:histidine kinase dimerization/phospho-acceptor domain-containing protein [Candidatus Omnitrophota bacterium]
MNEEMTKTRNLYSKEWIIWIALFILPFIFYPKAISSTWVSNSDVHALLEFAAATFALTAAGIILIHFFATGSRFFLMISLGFTLQGTEDLFHAIFSFSRIWPMEREGLLNFVPGTYVAGRLILIACIFLALYSKKTIVPLENRKRSALQYNFIGFIFAALKTIIIISLPLPNFILPGKFISRPVDFVASIAYLIAFLVFAKAYRNEENRTPFMWSLTASILLGFVAQIYMVHSQQLYDAQFDISHIVKISSYILPIFGIAVGTFSMYKKEEKTSKELSRSMEQLKNTQRELTQSEKMASVGQLAAGAAHEINNPLTVISGEAEMLLKNKDKLENPKESLKTIIEQAERVHSITERLLEFARSKPIKTAPLDINDVVERSLSLLKYQAGIGKVKILKKLNPGLPKIIGDDNQLQGVFLNIIQNAVQAMKGEKGRLTIKTYDKSY